MYHFAQSTGIQLQMIFQDLEVRQTQGDIGDKKQEQIEGIIAESERRVWTRRLFIRNSTELTQHVAELKGRSIFIVYISVFLRNTM